MDAQSDPSTTGTKDHLLNQVSCGREQSTLVFDINSCFRNLESAALPDEKGVIFGPNHLNEAAVVPDINQGRASQVPDPEDSSLMHTPYQVGQAAALSDLSWSYAFNSEAYCDPSQDWAGNTWTQDQAGSLWEEECERLWWGMLK